MEIETRSTFNGVVVADVDCKYSQISRSDIGAGRIFSAPLSRARVYLRPLLHRLPKL